MKKYLMQLVQMTYGTTVDSRPLHPSEDIEHVLAGERLYDFDKTRAALGPVFVTDVPEHDESVQVQNQLACLAEDEKRARKELQEKLDQIARQRADLLRLAAPEEQIVSSDETGRRTFEGEVDDGPF